MFDWAQWQFDFQKHCNYDADKIQTWMRFIQAVIQRFEQYQVPVIDLGKHTPRDAVCAVFEKVNTGGVTLTERTTLG